MTKKIYLMLLSVFLSVTYLSAQVVQTVNVPQGGGLATAIGSNLKTVTDLTLTGTINTADFNTIKQMTALKNLDMSDVSIVDSTIPDEAFRGKILNSLVLPEDLTIIGTWTFRDVTIVETLEMPSSLQIIESGAFQNSKIIVDLSRSKSNLTTLGNSCFSGNIGTKELDLSEFSLLKNFGAIGQYGTFDFYSGHVILPSYLDNVPAGCFASFKGTVTLSSSIKTIGENAFLNSNMESLILPKGLEIIGTTAFKNAKITEMLEMPSSLQIIESGAFQNSKIIVDLSRSKSNLTTLGNSCFSGNIGTKELDLSEFSLLKNFGAIGQYGTFDFYSGHVILPSYLDNVPAGCFASFKGTVTLSQNIVKIGENAFQQSTITSIELPSSVSSIGNNAFYNATQLSKIISNNPTPPALGTNVFYGVNKETTTLKVPDSSINRYGNASQWKDFLNISGRVPKEINLLYQIEEGYLPEDKWRPEIIEAKYTAVRIGEYYWMTQNFNHEEPYRQQWKDISSGFENRYPLTQEVIDKYLLDMKVPDQTQFRVDTAEFRKDFGSYYSFKTRDYMVANGRVYENNSTENNKGWSMPYIRDYRQLIAMSPFFNNSSDELTAHDAMYALAAGSKKNTMAGYSIIGSCGGNWGYWAHQFGDVGGDKYGFGLMPSGMRFNGPSEWGTEICGKAVTGIPATYGDLVQTYHRAVLPAKDGTLSFHETISTLQAGYNDGFYCENGEGKGYTGIAYQWFPVRWCRVLTDEELGYKLYIKINNISTSSKEWTLFAEQANEIKLLNYMRNNKISTDQTSIIKLGLNEVVPEGYIELPHGYIRGFYVQYILDNPNTTVTVSDVMRYAYGVQDFVLDYKQEYGRLPGWSIPSPTPEGACQASTRSLVSDEVVVPFKTDASVTLYPNPVQDVLNISGDGVERVSIYDMSGRQLSTAKNVNTISVSDLSKGTYLVRVLTANGESTHKVIKK